MSERTALLKKIDEIQFKAHEIALFLDTHPECTMALNDKKHAEEKYKKLIKEYEEKFGPLTVSAAFGDTGYNWVNAPWPWDK